MAFEALKARLGMGGRQRRYVDVETVADLEEISDPQTTTDETWQTFVGRAKTHPYLSLIVGVVGFLGVAIFLFWASRIAPGLLTNIWTLRFVGGLVLVGVGYRYGWENRRKRVDQWDELELDMGEKAVSYKGVYLDDLPGVADGFIPIKGWRAAGHKPEPYKAGELAAAMVESYQRHQIEDDSPAIIRLKPSETSVAHADWGTRVVQDSDGLEPDPHGNHSTLHATLPTYEDDRANDLADQLEQVTTDYYDILGEAEGQQRRIEELKERLNQPIEDEVEKRMKQIRRFEEVRSGRRASPAQQVGPRPQQDWQGTGSVGPSQNGSDPDAELQQVEEELTPDDD